MEHILGNTMVGNSLRGQSSNRWQNPHAFWMIKGYIEWMCVSFPGDSKHRKPSYRGSGRFPLMERPAVNDPGFFTESSKVNIRINWGK